MSSDDNDNDAAEAAVISPEPLDQATFRDGLNDLRSLKKLCDVTIVVQGRKFPAHKVVLAAGSPYFMTMFEEGHFIEGSSDLVQIDLNGTLSITAKAMEQLLDLFYTGGYTISGEDAAVELVAASDLLLLPDITAKALDFLGRRITIENCGVLLGGGLAIGGEKGNRWKSAAADFIRKNFVEYYSQTEIFLDLSEDALTAILKLEPNQMRDGPKEQVFFEATLAWCSNQRAARLGRFEGLAKHIRFQCISQNYLHNCLRENDIVKKNFKEFLKTKIRPLLLPFLRGQQLEQPVEACILVAIPQNSKTFHIIYFVGREIKGSSERTFPDEVYEHVSKFQDFGICNLGRYMFLIGGNKPEPKQSGFFYDVAYDDWTWSTNAPLSCFPASLSAIYDEVYFARKDRSRHPVRAGVSRLDLSLMPDQRSWKRAGELDRSRGEVHLAACETGRRIYAIGCRLATFSSFHERPAASAMVEKCTPAEGNVWTRVKSMKAKRSRPGIAVDGNGRLYVAGGYSCDHLMEARIKPLKSAEVYDPESNEWSDLPEMKYRRCSPAMAVCQEKLYVIGGGGLDGGGACKRDSQGLSVETGRIPAECLDLATLPRVWTEISLGAIYTVNAPYASAFFSALV